LDVFPEPVLRETPILAMAMVDDGEPYVRPLNDEYRDNRLYALRVKVRRPRGDGRTKEYPNSDNPNAPLWNAE